MIDRERVEETLGETLGERLREILREIVRERLYARGALKWRVATSINLRGIALTF